MKNTTKITKVIVSAIALVFICTGCLLSDLDEGHVETRYNSGLRAMDAGDFVTAKQMFYEAYQRTYAPGVQPWLRPACAYNFAICAGQLGNFEQAASWFKGALELDEKVNGKDWLMTSGRWLNLARLYSAWGKNDLSIEAYEKAIPLLEKYGQDKEKPLEFAIILGDYAIVLKKAGFDLKADSANVRAQKIRDEHPGETANPKFRYYPSK